jgi:cytochrome P450
MVEAQLILATVVRQYRVQLVPGQHVRPEPLITLRPSPGINVTLAPRAAMVA